MLILTKINRQRAAGNLTNKLAIKKQINFAFRVGGINLYATKQKAIDIVNAVVIAMIFCNFWLYYVGLIIMHNSTRHKGVYSYIQLGVNI